MQAEEEAPGTDHIQDFCNQVPSNKEQNEVNFEGKTTEALEENNINDQNNIILEGLQSKGINAAGGTNSFTLMQDVEEILGEAEKNQTILGPQVYLCCKTTVTVSKHLLFKYNCVASKNNNRI